MFLDDTSVKFRDPDLLAQGHFRFEPVYIKSINWMTFMLIFGLLEALPRSLWATWPLACRKNTLEIMMKLEVDILLIIWLGSLT